MGDYIDRFKRRVKLNGETNRDREIAQRIKAFQQYMSNAPNKFSIFIDSKLYDCTIQDVAFNDENKDDKIILTYLEAPLQVGTTLQWNNEYWIVVSIEQDSLPSHICGKIRQCNNILKVVIDSNAIEIPCIINDKTFNGVIDGAYFPIATGKVMITVPNNTDTQTVKRGNRFIFNKKFAYEVKYINEFIQGLITFTMEETLIIPKDDLINNIAYNEGTNGTSVAPSTASTTVGYVVNITGSDKIKFTSQQTYNATVYLDGNVVTDAVDWSVTDINDLTTNLVTLTKNGNVCTLKAGSTKGTIKLKCQIKLSSVYTEKLIQIITQF